MVASKIRENRPLRCMVYAIQNHLQAGGRILIWKPRARMGIYQGPLPRHMFSVSLLLNLETTMVSPQCHVQHDSFWDGFTYHWQCAHNIPVATAHRVHQEKATSAPNATCGIRSWSGHSRQGTKISITTGIMEESFRPTWKTNRGSQGNEKN